jgi:hypothetical protein
MAEVGRAAVRTMGTLGINQTLLLQPGWCLVPGLGLGAAGPATADSASDPATSGSCGQTD